MRASGEAPGKIILLGEHAVVYGQPAIGVPLSRGVRVELSSGSGLRSVTLKKGIELSTRRGATTPQMLIDRALGALGDEVDVHVFFDIAPMSGLGSSAALAVALLRARDNFVGRKTSARARLDEAIAIEDVAHGKSSGVDPAIALAAGPILFSNDGVTKKVRTCAPPQPLHLVVGARGGHGGTGRSVGRVRDLKSQAPALIDQTMSLLGSASRTAAKAIATHDLDLLGRTMDLAHGVLSGLGLVSDAIEDVIRTARARGALGAKMSGAGGDGGAFVALAADRASAEKIRRGIVQLGALAWCETIS